MSKGPFDPPRDLLDRLYRAAWALCDSPHEAEDLVQESFARVLARPRLLWRGDPAPYLLRTLRNTYLTGVRTAGRRPRTTGKSLNDYENLASSLARPDVVAEQREALAAIARLPYELRAALVAVDIVGLSHREAASALGVREATVATRIFRARQRLARSLGATAAEGGPATARA